MRLPKAPRFRPRAVREILLAILLVTVVLALQARTDGLFLTPRNLVQLASDRVPIGLLAIGMTFVILIAGIDLSVGSIVALAGLAFAMVWLRSASLPLALCGALGVGLAAGALNGLLTAGARIPALIVTLATLSVYRGIAAGLGGGESMSGFAEPFVAASRQPFLGIPLPTWLLLLLFAATGLYLARTEGGRAIYAMGANEAAARLAGVPVRRIRFRIYAFSGLLAGLAALTYAGFYNSFRSDVGRGYELDAITVVVLGGTSVAGGEGTMLGTALAFALIAAGRNGMDLAGIQSERQSMYIALVLILALWLDSRVRAARSRA